MNAMDRLRSLPKVDALSRSPELAPFPERVRMEAARRAVAQLRAGIQANDPNQGDSAAAVAARLAQEMTRSSLGLAINVSGVILHTGLGRARLAQAATEALSVVAAGHSTLEIDLDDGKRGDRQEHVRELFLSLTGAEDALVLNNAAAAVVLSLAALARGKEVILSRGQMVEIGGSFRMPEIVGASGCELVEVGCTNKTHLSDYERAITSETGAILRCHTSNYKILGFTEMPSLAEVASIARSRGVPVVDDMGTGCIIDTARFGMPALPTIQDSLEGGADLVTASGDKLLGGPQAGMLLGRKEFVEKARKHPLARAFRIDKLTLAALEATLKLYFEGREMEIPTLRYLNRSPDEVEAMARRLAAATSSAVVSQGITEIGGGSAPGTGIPTWRAGLSSDSADALARRLRQQQPPILARIEDGLVWLDPRTLEPDELEYVCGVLSSL